MKMLGYGASRPLTQPTGLVSIARLAEVEDEDNGAPELPLGSGTPDDPEVLEPEGEEGEE